MVEIKTFQATSAGRVSVTCHVAGTTFTCHLQELIPTDEEGEESAPPKDWIEAYAQRHMAQFSIKSHYRAACAVAEVHQLGGVNPDPIDATARGYVFQTTGQVEGEKIVTNQTIKKPAREKREPIPDGALSDPKEVTQELVNGWIDSFRTKGEGRMDWHGIVDAVKENHGIQLPNANRHPVSTKVQRCFRAIVGNDMQPVVK